ncbi:hypothetical protein C8F01DRAFT_25708 [Mycena amicta]|nr:hypothetical protein C8F01DRAFT_25708 [Mycena amicta]
MAGPSSAASRVTAEIRSFPDYGYHLSSIEKGPPPQMPLSAWETSKIADHAFADNSALRGNEIVRNLTLQKHDVQRGVEYFPFQANSDDLIPCYPRSGNCELPPRYPNLRDTFEAQIFGWDRSDPPYAEWLELQRPPKQVDVWRFPICDEPETVCPLDVLLDSSKVIDELLQLKSREEKRRARQFQPYPTSPSHPKQDSARRSRRNRRRQCVGPSDTVESSIPSSSSGYNEDLSVDVNSEDHDALDYDGLQDQASHRPVRDLHLRQTRPAVDEWRHPVHLAFLEDSDSEY